MKKLFKSILFVFAIVLTGLLFSCKNNEQDGYSDKIETLQATDTSATSVSDTTDVSGLSTTNKSTKGSSGKDKGGTGTGTGPSESAKDGATDSGPSEEQ
ncbi:hypothetical protein [Flavobacterium fluviatile]|uniref:hypothetical protein n=1 Tax=Flavobacterium fluviatile TaxID=1862387 RepID=UPI0013D01D5E|nr:hypothetical protein [Flavobacterium fluviatile]